MFRLLPCYFLVFLDELNVDGREKREDVCLNHSDQNLDQIDDNEDEHPERPRPPPRRAPP